MITQKEIARKLGISRTTVARAINGSPLIKEETKKKVMEIVRATNYEKNYIGSSLGAKKIKKVVALVVASKNEFYTNEITRGINNLKNEYKSWNYQIEIKKSDINDSKGQLEILKEVLSRQDVDGLIITPLDTKKAHKLILKHLDRLKVISLGIRLDENIPHVGPDHKKQGIIAGGLMSKMLRGGEHLLVIDNGDDKVSSKLYLEGFLERVEGENLKVIKPHSFKSIESAIEYLKKVLREGDVDGLYINRYAHDILNALPYEILKDKKIVTNGMGKIIEKLLREGIIHMTVMEEIALEGYTSAKRVFEMLYKEQEYTDHWDISKSCIMTQENLEDKN